jgi:2-methylcitrate dehydratase PrpD
MHRAPATLAAQLADFTAGLDITRVPARVRERAKHLILDAVGCALAATKFDFAAPSLRALEALGGAGASVVIGRRERLLLRDAMLANGILAHGLDYDDTHTAGVIHLTVTTFPCALGLGAQRGADGGELLAAYVAGVEAGARIAAAAQGGFHRVGFHPKSVVGTFACALVAGKLYRLTPAQLELAQGIALSAAAGSLEFLEDGAWTKRFHAGWAAVGGVTAAALAAEGFVGPRAAYEGRFGLYRSHLGPLADACDHGRVVAGLGDTWELENVAVKPFPACHLLHGCADAALALARQGVRPADIAAITARVPAAVVPVVCEPVANKRRPQNDYDAKFSVPFVVAAALARGRFGLAELAPEALADGQILALADKVRYEVDPTMPFPKYYPGEVVVRLAGGRELRQREEINRGAAERPITNEEVIAKFMDNALTATTAARARAIAAAVLGLDRGVSARALADTLAG